MSSPFATLKHSWPREVSAGVVAGVVSVLYAVSYAALLFQGSLAHLVPYGMGLCLASALFGAFWLAWRSQLPFALGGPDGNTLSILAAMAATVSTSGAAASGAGLLQVLLLLAITTLLCAVLFLALGVGRLGLAVRYIPYPVIGGFLASTGWLIAVGGLRVGGDLAITIDTLSRLPKALAEPQLLATLALGLAYLAVLRVWRNPFAMPALLFGSALLVFAGLAIAGVPVQQARVDGWLFDHTDKVQWMAPWQWLRGPGAIDWSWIAGQWLDMLAVAAVAVITVLLGASGLEVMSRSDISLDHELRLHGWLNLASAALGGTLSLVSVSRSAVLLDGGARTRAAGLVAAGVCAITAVGATLLLGWVPRVVLGAFLFYLGATILWDWVVASRRRLGLADWALVIIILATTITIGFAIAVVAGVLASSLNFALSYSRVGVVQHDLDGTALRSAVLRPAAHRQLLAAHGKDIRVLVLRGVIFFGTASAVLEQVRSFLERPAGGARRELVLDFSHVASADSSAGLTFTKIAQLAAAGGVDLVMCGLGPATRAVAPKAGEIAATLDLALDAAEEKLLAANGVDPAAMPEPLDQWLPRELGGVQHWERLVPLLRRHELPAGSELMHQADASNATLYLIEKGRLLVRLEGQAEGRRLASLMAGNIVGEMALYSNANRSASVTAERDTVVWSLDREALEELHTSAPETAMQVHSFVVRTLAERVRQANMTIAALQDGA
ncbi:MAG: SLC26A/SulP transporter family protein [Burkholderiales bacterium]|nr:SLC26A/SulP transporter family protein [Burkholderiales bacterium]